MTEPAFHYAPRRATRADVRVGMPVRFVRADGAACEGTVRNVAGDPGASGFWLDDFTGCFLNHGDSARLPVEILAQPAKLSDVEVGDVFEMDPELMSDAGHDMKQPLLCVTCYASYLDYRDSDGNMSSLFRGNDIDGRRTVTLLGRVVETESAPHDGPVVELGKIKKWLRAGDKLEWEGNPLTVVAADTKPSGGVVCDEEGLGRVVVSEQRTVRLVSPRWERVPAGKRIQKGDVLCFANAYAPTVYESEVTTTVANDYIHRLVRDPAPEQWERVKGYELRVGDQIRFVECEGVSAIQAETWNGRECPMTVTATYDTCVCLSSSFVVDTYWTAERLVTRGTHADVRKAEKERVGGPKRCLSCDQAFDTYRRPHWVASGHCIHCYERAEGEDFPERFGTKLPPQPPSRLRSEMSSAAAYHLDDDVDVWGV